MSQLLQEILKEPNELIGSLHYNLSAGRAAMDRAVATVRAAGGVFITGIGSSWHAGMAVQSFLLSAGLSAHLVDASELLNHVAFPPNAALIILSRSGKSVEVVKLLDKAAAAGTKVIGVTNTPGSPLGQRADTVLRLEAAFDHNVSITMYSALTLVGGLLTSAAAGAGLDDLRQPLERMLGAAGRLLPTWQHRLRGHAWLNDEVGCPYFLARGASAASAYETRLLWEEAAKAPACSMTTGGFRHGPQEMITAGTRIGLWIDDRVLRNEDLALARDLRELGCRVMLIGSDVPDDAADLVLPLPPRHEMVPGWQFLVDIIPAQLAAEAMAQRRGVDCDTFRICPYIIESEGGLRAATA